MFTTRVQGGKLRGPYRLSYMLRQIRKHIDRSKATIAVIEDYAVNKKMGVDSVLGLAELSGNIKRELWDLGIDILLVRPTTMKMVVAGNGHADKKEVRAAIYNHLGLHIPQLDESDACGLMITGEVRCDITPLPGGERQSQRLKKLRDAEIIKGRLHSIAN